MFDATSPSDPAAAVPLRRRWADGAAEVTVTGTGDATRLHHLYQSDPCRVLFPRVVSPDPMEAVIVTTSGGVVGGDRLRFALEAGEGSVATITTQAAEKVYRSGGADAEIDIAVHVGDGARLEWMPQETILFDGARLRRRTHAVVYGSGRLLAGEIVVFGRRARGETFSHGLLHDAWRIHVAGRLAWADALHLDGDLAGVFDDPHAFGAAAALGTMIYAGPGAADRLPTMRHFLEDGPGAAASRIDDVVIARFLDRDAAALRARFARLWKHFRHAEFGHPARLPRVWEV